MSRPVEGPAARWRCWMLLRRHRFVEFIWQNTYQLAKCERCGITRPNHYINYIS